MYNYNEIIARKDESEGCLIEVFKKKTVFDKIKGNK